jgi:hypothetical protein
MPVRKYRSIEEMEETVLPPGDPEIPQRMRYLARLAAAFRRQPFRPGVRRYRSLEEQDEDSRRPM